MSIPEIANHLSVGRLAVYAMLEQGLLPGIRLGRRWIVTRARLRSLGEDLWHADGRADGHWIPPQTSR